VECSLANGDAPPNVVVPTRGLVEVASVRLDGRTSVEMRIATNSAERGRLVAGDAVLILDRVRSPDALWR